MIVQRADLNLESVIVIGLMDKHEQLQCFSLVLFIFSGVIAVIFLSPRVS